MNTHKSICLDNNTLVGLLVSDTEKNQPPEERSQFSTGDRLRRKLEHVLGLAEEKNLPVCFHANQLDDFILQVEQLQEEGLPPNEHEEASELITWASLLKQMLTIRGTRGRDCDWLVVYGDPMTYVPAQTAEQLGRFVRRNTLNCFAKIANSEILAFALMEDAIVFSSDEGMEKMSEFLRFVAMDAKQKKSNRERLTGWEILALEAYPYPLLWKNLS